MTLAVVFDVPLDTDTHMFAYVFRKIGLRERLRLLWAEWRNDRKDRRQYDRQEDM